MSTKSVLMQPSHFKYFGHIANNLCNFILFIWKNSCCRFMPLLVSGWYWYGI